MIDTRVEVHQVAGLAVVPAVVPVEVDDGEELARPAEDGDGRPSQTGDWVEEVVVQEDELGGGGEGADHGAGGGGEVEAAVGRGRVC